MLKLSKTAFDKIRNHGERSFPDECCGVLFGKTNGKERYVLDVLEIHNSFDPAEQYHRFLITPDNYRSAEKKLARRGLMFLDSIIRIRILLRQPPSMTLTTRSHGFRT